MKRERQKTHKGILVLISAGAIAACVFAACLSTDRTGDTNEALVAWINEINAVDPAWASSMIESLQVSRAESIYAESVRESRSIAESISAAEEASSIAESILQSSIEESRSIEESIRESVYESSVAESSIAASYAAVFEAAEAMAKNGGNGSPVPIEAGKILVIGDDSIPKIRELFANTVIIGNMQARGILDTGILTGNTVLYKWYGRMDQIADIVDQGAALGRKKVLFIMGVNDIGYYQGNVEAWKNGFKNMITRFRNTNPGAEIYLQEILQIPAEYEYRWHNYYRIPRYNEALYELAGEVGATVVSAADYAFQGFLCDETGAQYDKRFHFFWAQVMAIQMGLWEE